MHLEKIELKNFRCFSKASFDLSSDITIIYGNNGSGKTSIIEAIHYLCYLTSFRSRLPLDIAEFESDSFFIKGSIRQAGGEVLDLQVGFAQKKKVAKIGQNPILSYKELFPYYQIVTITIDDLELIQSSPIVRRSFIDQAILLADPNFIEVLQRYRQIVQQRNALLVKPFSYESYLIWTQQLWQASMVIQKARIQALELLNKKISQLLTDFFDKNYTLEIIYNYKHMQPDESFDSFLERKKSLVAYEPIIKRSDFGAHLDDFTFNFCSKKIKSFGSRGQQKLLVLLIKIAQILNLQDKQNFPILLIDDFITDFDKEKLQSVIDLLLTLDCQLIITSPIREKLLEDLLSRSNISTIELI